MIEEILLLSILISAPLAFGCVEPWSLAVFESASFLLLLICSLRKPPSAQAPVLRTLFPAVSALALLALFQGLNPAPCGEPASLWPFSASAYGSRQAVMLWGGYAALIWCIPHVLDTPRRMDRFIWAVFILGVVLAIIGIIQLGQGNKSIYGLRRIPLYRGPFGPLYNRNHAAALLTMSMFAGLGIFCSRLSKFKRLKNIGESSDLVATQAMILSMISVIIFGLLKTRSRGAALSIFASAFFMGLLSLAVIKSWARRAALLLSLGAVAGAGMLFVQRFPGFVGMANGNWDVSVVGRFSIYRGALVVFRDFPVFGIGLGSLRSAFPAYEEKLFKGFVVYMHSHWLDLLLQSGCFGLVCYLAGLLMLAVSVYRNWMKSSIETCCLAGGLMAGFLSFVLWGLVDSPSQTTAVGVCFFCIAACLGAPALWRRDSDARPADPKVLLACFSAIMAILSLRPAIASFFAWRASTASESSRPYYWSRALAWDQNPRYLCRLGASYVDLAASNPAAQRILLRLALNSAGEGLRREPVDFDLLNLNTRILWGLDRHQDARELFERAKKVDFRL